jgi:TatD DNase family protein
MLIDVHAHLDFSQFDEDREKVIEKARKENIKIITSGMGPKSIKKTIAMIEKYDNLFATFGSLPEELNQDVIEETINLIKKNRDKIVGIGEVGLDYYWMKDKSKRKVEIENFHKFIELANELSLPLVIHSRDAEQEVIRIIKEKDINALLHCFSGSVEQAENAVSFGCLISIPTNIIYSKQKQILAKKIPLESIVLESDAPFLSPIPKTRNVPVNIKLSVEKIAEIKNVDLERVGKITTRNAIEFFNLKL